MTIDVGLVGFGFAGRVFHAPIISAVPGLRLRAIVQRSAGDAAVLYPQTTVVQSVEELLAIDEIRLVVIATPNTSHYGLAKQSLLADRDVVVDKPFTTTYQEASELIGMAKQHGRLLTVYQNLRSNGDFRTIRNLVEGQRLGRIALYEAHFDRYRLQTRPGAWREKVEPGSGVFFDLGVHLIDQAMQLFGPPATISADIRIEREAAVVDDAFDVVLHYPRMRALLRASMVAIAPDLRFVIRGEKAAFVKYGIDPQEEALKRGEIPRDDSWGREAREKWGTLYCSQDAAVTAETIETLPGDYRLFYANVRDAILGSASVDVTHEQMLDVMHALELARESSRRQCTLNWRSL
ncbi:MAG: oxidoreductase [Acidobacteria bacterium]|nr:MAG: oxidoreductase [Acidobacteriota bacterium]PYY02835.1 MAG: oxidoreductase [Acidobacteriota bacterium]